MSPTARSGARAPGLGTYRLRLPGESISRVPPRHPTGMTLLELLITILLVGVLASTVVLRSTILLDAIAVRAAQYEVAALFGYARDVALGGQHPTAVHIDGLRGLVTVARGGTTLAARQFGARGIQVAATRDSMAYTAAGLGYGAANLRVILSKGASAETLMVSRLGRVDRR